MKKKFSTKNRASMLLALFTSLACPACQKSAGQQQFNTLSGKQYSVPIPADSANRMIKSYLDGINYKQNTHEIRSLVCNADKLRTYLSNPTIKNVKLLFAHNMDWINSGHEGQRPGPNDNAITIIIAGLDNNLHYVSYPATETGSPVTAQSIEVLDRLAPCPYDCMGDDYIGDEDNYVNKAK